ncbi:hypothetical protein HPB48_012097 [Haemaphysalis longicornis]|uniref:Gag-like protein n=1 Tax=Haemaphysalis longicornis TaxID=44386 RepID=A0A9J6GLE2_HAELO|nr:hypothetical protein HPB48_012097 [Haemaphysalis longicornis]
MASPAYLMALVSGMTALQSRERDDESEIDSDGETTLDSISPSTTTTSRSGSSSAPIRTALNPSRLRKSGYSACGLQNTPEDRVLQVLQAPRQLPRPNILQWNCRSLRMRHADSHTFLLANKTYCLPSEHRLPGYVAYHSATACAESHCTATNCREAAHEPGCSKAAIYVRSGCAHSEVNLTGFSSPHMEEQQRFPPSAARARPFARRRRLPRAEEAKHEEPAARRCLAGAAQMQRERPSSPPLFRPLARKGSLAGVSRFEIEHELVDIPLIGGYRVNHRLNTAAVDTQSERSREALLAVRNPVGNRVYYYYTTQVANHATPGVCSETSISLARGDHFANRDPINILRATLRQLHSSHLRAQAPDAVYIRGVRVRVQHLDPRPSNVKDVALQPLIACRAATIGNCGGSHYTPSCTEHTRNVRTVVEKERNRSRAASQNLRSARRDANISAHAMSTTPKPHSRIPKPPPPRAATVPARRNTCHPPRADEPASNSDYLHRIISSKRAHTGDADERPLRGRTPGDYKRGPARAYPFHELRQRGRDARFSSLPLAPPSRKETSPRKGERDSPAKNAPPPPPPPRERTESPRPHASTSAPSPSPPRRAAEEPARTRKERETPARKRSPSAADEEEGFRERPRGRGQGNNFKKRTQTNTARPLTSPRNTNAPETTVLTVLGNLAAVTRFATQKELAHIPGLTACRVNHRLSTVAVDTNNEQSRDALLRGAHSAESEGTSVFLVFDGPEAPAAVNIAGVRCRVQTLPPRPLQCEHCGRFNHYTSACRSAPRCKNCGGEHVTTSCTEHTQRCANCGGSHHYSSPRCRQWRREKEIAAQARSQEVPLRVARQRYYNQPRPQPPPDRRLYSNVLRGPEIQRPIPAPRRLPPEPRAKTATAAASPPPIQAVTAVLQQAAQALQEAVALLHNGL